MLIRNRQPYESGESDVTDERLFKERRKFLKQGVYAGSAVAAANYFPQMAYASIQKFGGPHCRCTSNHES